MKEDMIRTITINSIIGKKETLINSCPFWKVGEVNKDWLTKKLPILKTSTCSLIGIDCVFGLTEIRVPKECPLKKKEGVTTVCVSLKKGNK